MADVPRQDETALNTRKYGCMGLLMGLAVVGTFRAAGLSLSGAGPMTMMLVMVMAALYGIYGWVLIVAMLRRSLLARRVLAREITPIATAPAGQSVVVRGTVQGHDAAFEAWFPHGARAVWQSVVVTDRGGKTIQHLARRHREAASFDVADAEGARVRVELAGAELVPEDVTASGRTLSPVGRQELAAIPGISGERDDLSIRVELIRYGATVQIEGQLTHDPDPVMRSAEQAPLRIVVLANDGIDDATRALRRGIRAATIGGALTIGALAGLLVLLRR